MPLSGAKDEHFLAFIAQGPSIKDVGIFLAVFDTPFPHVGILTLIYLTSAI